MHCHRNSGPVHGRAAGHDADQLAARVGRLRRSTLCRHVQHRRRSVLICREGQVFIGDVVERFPDALRHSGVGQMLAFSGASSVTIGGWHGCRPTGLSTAKNFIREFQIVKAGPPISTEFFCSIRLRGLPGGRCCWRAVGVFVFQPAGRGRNALARRSLIWGPAVIPLPPRARPAGVAISSNAGRGLSFCEDGGSAGEPAPARFVSRGKSRLASEARIGQFGSLRG